MRFSTPNPGMTRDRDDPSTEIEPRRENEGSLPARAARARGLPALKPHLRKAILSYHEIANAMDPHELTAAPGPGAAGRPRPIATPVAAR